MFSLFLFLCFYLPFGIALNPANGVDLASLRVLILGVFVFWLFAAWRKKEVVLKNNLATWLVNLFLFLNLLSIFAAVNTAWAARKLLYLFSIFPIYFVAASLVNNRARLTKVLKVLVSGGVLAAAAGSIQFFSQFIFGLTIVQKFSDLAVRPFLGENFGAEILANPSWFVNIGGKTYLRAVSFFPDPHMFAFFLGMLFPLAFGLGLFENKKWLAAAAVIFAADLLTFSRGGYVGLIAGVLFFGYVSWRSSDKRAAWASGVLVAILGLALLLPGPVASRFDSSFNPEEGSNAGRLSMWQTAERIVLTKPFLGVGIGNFSLAVDPNVTYRNSIYAHNTYLDVAAETGLLNALVWAGILLAAFWGLWEKARKDMLYLGLAAAVAVFAVHSLADTALYWPPDLALLLLIIAFNDLPPENKALKN
jgi:O-antigen ligase